MAHTIGWSSYRCSVNLMGCMDDKRIKTYKTEGLDHLSKTDSGESCFTSHGIVWFGMSYSYIRCMTLFAALDEVGELWILTCSTRKLNKTMWKRNFKNQHAQNRKIFYFWIITPWPYFSWTFQHVFFFPVVFFLIVVVGLGQILTSYFSSRWKELKKYKKIKLKKNSYKRMIKTLRKLWIKRP